MKLNKIKKIVKKIELECEVTEITLLSEEEYEKYRELIPLVDLWWWLRSSFIDPYWLAIVSCGALDYASCTYTGIGVRPVLWIELAESLKPGDKIELNDITWTVLDSADGKIYVLADKVITCCRFDGESNIWEESELKKWLEEWKESWTE